MLGNAELANNISVKRHAGVAKRRNFESFVLNGTVGSNPTASVLAFR